MSKSSLNTEEKGGSIAAVGIVLATVLCELSEIKKRAWPYLHA